MSYNYNNFIYNGSNPLFNAYYDIGEFTSDQNYTWNDSTWGNLSSVDVITSNNLVTSGSNYINFVKSGIYEITFTFSYYFQSANSAVREQKFRLNESSSSSTFASPYFYAIKAFGSDSRYNSGDDYSVPTSTVITYMTPTVTTDDSENMYVIYYSHSGNSGNMDRQMYYFRGIINAPNDNYEIYPQFFCVGGSYLTNGTYSGYGYKPRYMVRLISTVSLQP